MTHKKTIRPCLLIALKLILMIMPLTAIADQTSTPPQILFYKRPEISDDLRGAFPLRVLRLALSKVAANYTLMPANSVMDQGRALQQLELPDGGMDVVWTMTSTEREKRFTAIRIPFDKGLVGWRLALIAKTNPEKLKSVESLNDLQQFIACQGHDWPDTLILRANGLRVVVDSYYRNLFQLLAQGSADYFPRSALEIWSEVDTKKAADMMIDPYIAIHYPGAMYFFVNKSNQKLADEITRGMEKAIADHSFERLFQSEYGENLRKAKFSTRRVIELKNPFLPAQTPLNRKELWLNP